MKFLLHLILIVAISSCATGAWKAVGGAIGHIVSKTADRKKREFDEKNSPYKTVRAQECRRKWWGGQECRWVVKSVRKDGQPLTEEENRRLNGK